MAAYQGRQVHDFQRYAAGKKRYGAGRTAPNIGPVADKLGYRQRDNRLRTKRNAILRRMKAKQRGAFASANYLRGGHR